MIQDYGDPIMFRCYECNLPIDHMNHFIRKDEDAPPEEIFCSDKCKDKFYNKSLKFLKTH